MSELSVALLSPQLLLGRAVAIYSYSCCVVAPLEVPVVPTYRSSSKLAPIHLSDSNNVSGRLWAPCYIFIGLNAFGVGVAASDSREGIARVVRIPRSAQFPRDDRLPRRGLSPVHG